MPGWSGSGAALCGDHEGYLFSPGDMNCPDGGCRQRSEMDIFCSGELNRRFAYVSGALSATGAPAADRFSRVRERFFTYYPGTAGHTLRNSFVGEDPAKKGKEDPQ
jgi:hypothetical protein